MAHRARGKPVALASPYDPRYTGGGPGALTDGVRGVADHRHPAWQGYWRHSLDATIDLGKATAVGSIRSTYLQSTAVGIWLPSSVEYAVSADGKTFRVVATVANDVPAKKPGPLVKEFAAKLPATKARYIRVRAKSLGTMPAWHHAAGQKAWLFVDEIAVR
jgi:hexosaminidase